MTSVSDHGEARFYTVMMDPGYRWGEDNHQIELWTSTEISYITICFLQKTDWDNCELSNPPGGTTIKLVHPVFKFNSLTFC